MRQPNGNVFLVVEPDPTVARDLEETLQTLDPDATVWTATATAEAQAVLGGLDRVSAAFLRLPAAEMRSAEIPEAIEARGGRIVVLDVRPADPWAHEREGWLFTGRPFGAGAVANALRRLDIA